VSGVRCQGTISNHQSTIINQQSSITNSQFSITYTTYHKKGMFLKLLIASLLGGILGLERELKGKPGGVKTNALVSLASCAFMIMVIHLNPTEQARVMTGIIQGVGFIGGGLIVKEGTTAKGLTGAAEIWVASSIGLACSLEMWRLAIMILMFAVLILQLTRWTLPK
jgi:putative Mg2+ transporter-C (MgtC) family protein